jgi:hypothetical protein
METEQIPAQEPASPKNKKEGRLYKLGRWTVRLIFTLFVVFLLLSLLLQVPAVQNRVARYATAELSEYLGATVSISKLDIALFNKVVLEDFYVQDPECDTLFYSKTLAAGINPNIFTLLGSGLEINELWLKGAELNVNRPQGAARSNLQWLLDQFASKKKKKNKKPFLVSVRRINIEQVQYSMADDVKGSYLSARIPKGLIRISEMNLPAKILRIEQCVLHQPLISIESRPEIPLIQALPTAMGRKSTQTDTLSWTLEVQDFDLSEGAFFSHNYRKAPTKTTPDNAVDFKHLDLTGINVRFNNVLLERDTLHGVAEHISASASGGFVLEQLAVRDVMMTPKSIVLHGLEIITPQSRIGDTLAFSFENYAAFEDFTSSVGMDARFHQASVAVQDIMAFAPTLERNDFFQNNRNEKIKIDGRIRGTVNDLSGRNLEIELAKGATLKGRLDLKDITLPGQGYFGLSLQDTRTSMAVLQQIIPRFNLPANFNRLGRIQFQGDINGFVGTGFTIYGDLRSDLGAANLDMTLNPNGGKEKATYSGNLQLRDFDLGAWTGDPNLGKVSLDAGVQEGRSLVAAKASAKLTAELRSFYYKKYEYKNASLSGSLNRNFFNGDFAIQDDNVDFTFNGKLDFSKKIPEFNFKADLRHLDLKSLNLSDKDLIIACKVNLDGRSNKLADIEGTGHIENLHITLDQDETFSVNRIDFESRLTGPDTKIMRVLSEVVEAKVEGRFEVDKLAALFTGHLLRNHPGFARRLGMKAPKRAPAPARFSFEVNVKDSKGFNHLLSPQLAALRDVRVAGGYDDATDSLVIDAYMPVFEMGDLKLDGPFFSWNAKGGMAELGAGMDVLAIKSKPFLGTPLVFQGFLRSDSLNFGLTYASKGTKVLDNLQLNGILAAADSNAFTLHFDQSNLTLMNRLWLINQDNSLWFSKDSVKVNNLVLTHDTHRIGIESAGKKGLRLALIDFNFDLIEKVWDYEPLNFSGPFNVFVKVEDVVKMQGLSLTLISPELRINDDDWGILRLDASAPDLKSRINGIYSIETDNSQIWGSGFYNLQDIKGRSISRSFEENRKKYFQVTSFLSGVPLRTVEYFLPGVITGTQGTVNGEVTFNGIAGNPRLEGNLTINDGKFTIDFLKTTYNFRQAIVQMNDNWLFDASGVRVYDKYGHSAQITGGIRHSRLKDLRIDATINTPRLLAIDTKKGDSKQFYGQAIGRGYARFSGPLDRIDAYINGHVNDSTRLVIPISSDREAQAIQYVNFVNRKSEEEAEARPARPATPKGMNVEMELTIGSEAVMQLIIDEQAGDVVEGKGRGNIRISLPRNADFQMFGEYLIEEGDYLFTLYNVVNKKFQVQRGGSIRWSGDPYKAIIRLDAEYKGINTSVAGFIADFLAGASTQVKTEAAKSTQVNLILHLAGELFKPQINFDLEFPLLTGELKNYADSKLRILQQDPNELNRQAFGLIVAGQFLPDDLSVQANDAIFNTVSELLSNQLSLLLTDLFSEMIADGRVLSGIDFDVAYSQYRPGDDVNRPGRGEEFEVRLRQNYFNDRLSVVVGGNYDTGGSNLAATPGANSGAFLGNDVVIEYAISADRSLTLKVYQRLQPDIGGRRFKVGAGLSFRKEYDSFGDFLRSIKLAGGKKNKQPVQ